MSTGEKTSGNKWKCLRASVSIWHISFSCLATVRSTSEGDKLVDDISELVGQARNNGLSTYQVPLELMNTHAHTHQQKSMSVLKQAQFTVLRSLTFGGSSLPRKNGRNSLKKRMTSDSRCSMQLIRIQGRCRQGRQKECNNRRLFFCSLFFINFQGFHLSQFSVGVSSKKAVELTSCCCVISIRQYENRWNRQNAHNGKKKKRERALNSVHSPWGVITANEKRIS